MTATTDLQEAIQSAIDFAVIATDLEGVVTEWSAGAEQVYGWRGDEIVGEPVDRLFTPEDRACGRPAEEMRLADLDGRAPDERWHVRKDGVRFWASGELQPTHDTAGVHRGYVKIVRDSTGQHEVGDRLRRSEERFRTLLETMDAAFAIVEVKFDADDRPIDYRFLEANPAFEQEAGVNLRGKWVTEFAPNLEPFWFEAYGRVAKTRRPTKFESHAAAFGRWFDVRAVPVGDPDERQIAIFFNDSTARRTAEEKLRESEALVRENADRVRLALAAGAIVGTWLWDLPTDRFTVDEAFAEAYGLDPAVGRAALTLKQVTQTVHPDDKPSLIAAIQEVAARGGHYVQQYRVRRADGLYHWIEANGRVDLAADGSPSSFPGILIDIGERRALTEQRDQALAQLRRLAETLERQVVERTAERDRMWETSPDLMLVIDFGGVLRRVNPSWTRTLGYMPEELVGRHVNEFVLPDDHSETVEAYEALARGRQSRVLNRYRHKNGSFRYISWAAAPAGNVIYATGRDVTSEKQQAETLRQTEEQLRQSQKLEAVGQLTGGVAHDFNNLLTIIRSSVDFLKREELPPARRSRYVEAISQTVERAAKLTSQLLAFARRQPLNPQVFDVNVRLQAVSELVRPLMGARIDIKVELCERPCHAEADVSQFETALVNLAVNARDAMDGEGQLTFKVREASSVPPIRGHAGAMGEFIAVCVADTGHGIAPDQLASIFEPFYTTKEVGRGTGLGLSQVFGFTKQSGGEVDVESELGGGAAFTLYLPRVSPVDEEAGALRDERQTQTSRDLSILVVEDNDTVGRFADEMLRDLGYKTRLVGSAGDALAALEHEGAGFDVVFSDVIMPGMNGVELAREVRRRFPELPIVLTSGYSSVLAQEGAYGFELLRKPYSIDELSRMLRSVAGV